MGVLDWFKRNETRASGGSFTKQVMDARTVGISGASGIGELTATVQTCVGLWESGLSLASVRGTDALTARALGVMGRSLGLHGEAVFLVSDSGLVPVSDWDVKTRDGVPVAYRITLPDTGGGRSLTVLAGEVFHPRIATDPATPWAGQAPLRRASITAGLLQAVESALSDVYTNAPLGSMITPMPEQPEVDNESLARSFRGQRGRVLLRESTQVSAAGGPAPVTDWKPSDLSPDISRSMTAESLRAARHAILSVYGVLPSLMDPQAAGPSVREGQRHLAQWQLQPIAAQVAQEATDKLGTAVELDVMQPVQAYDAGGRARAMKGMVEGIAMAKQAGLSDDEMAAVMKFAGTDE